MKKINLLTFAYLFLLSISSQICAAPIFNITAPQTTITMAIGATQEVAFIVTNNTNKASKNLALYLNNAPNSTVSSSNMCLGALGPRASCTLKLLVTAPRVASNFTLTPKVCGFGGLACSVPNQNNIITVNVRNSQSGAKVYVPVYLNSTSYALQVVDTITNTISTLILFTDRPVITAVVTPDGKKVYMTSKNSVVVADPESKTYSSIFLLDASPGLALTPDGSMLYASAANDIIYVINTATDTISSTINFPTNNTMVISPNGKTLYAASTDIDHNVAVIDIATNTITAILTLEGQGTSMAVTPDGSKLYIGDINQNLNIFNTATNALISKNYFPTINLNHLVFSPDGSKLYIGDAVTSIITVLNPSSLTRLNTIFAGTGNMFGLGVTPDGKKIYASGGPFNLYPGSQGYISDISTTTETVTQTIITGLIAFVLGIGK